MNPRPRAAVALCLAAGALALLAGCGSGAPEIAELSGETMGTRYHVRLSPPPDADERARLDALISDALEGVNAAMSTYREDSALSRFNAARDSDWVPVPGSVVELVDLARSISAQTGGAYDVTVAPLVDLWGFGPDGRRDAPPSDAEIEAVLPGVGFAKLATRRDPPALRKTVPALQVDLSSIAKGWAVDEIARLLEQAGHHGYLVEIGGEIRTGKAKADGSPWRIAVESPVADRREVKRVVPLTDTSMATSGDYRNFFESGGRRYSHTLDPRTGRSVEHALGSVTVFAPTCAEADAWATALLALGEQRGPAVADAAGIEALFVIRNDAGLVERTSAALQASGRLAPPVR
jgi:thiamine biosynthesis lipoprotein